MATESIERSGENPIEKIATSVYPAFALLAGMQLDLFTPLKDGPMNAKEMAATIGVHSVKLKALLYALVVAGFLNVEGECFTNTALGVLLWRMEAVSSRLGKSSEVMPLRMIIMDY